jgi:3-oxoadipate enol-lactonase
MIINNRNLAVEVDGSGPSVLFLHGLGGTSNFYQPQAEALAEHFQVIRIDSAGAGRSPAADGITVDSHAADAAAILDALGVASAAVVGHSMGTLVARLLAAARPGLVNRLALLAVIGTPADGGRIQRARAALLRDQGTAPVAAAVVATAVSELTRRDRPEIAAFVRELVMRQDAEGYARNYEALAAASDPGPVSPAVPLLLISGGDDRIAAPHTSRQLAEDHGHATAVVIDGIGHWTAIEAAVRTTELLTEFLLPGSTEQ